MKKAGQIGMAGAVGYGGYRALNTTVGQNAAQAASQRIGQTYENAGVTLNEFSATRDAYGRAYRPGYRQFELHEQAINESIASGAGTAAGIGAAGLGYAAYSLNPFGNVASAAASGLAKGGLTKGFGAIGKMGSALLGGGAAGGAFAGGAQAVGAGAASVAGPLAGAMAGFMPAVGISYGINRAANAVIGNVSRQRGAEKALDQMSYRFTPGTGSNLVTGRGLGYDQTADVARDAREVLTEELFVRQGDFDEILSGITQNDLIYNVRGAEEFKEKFREVTETLRTISRTFETSMEEATGLLGDMQRSGFYTTADQTRALLNSDAIGRMTGQTSREVIQTGASGSQTARQHGLSGSLGFETNLRAGLALEEAVRMMGPEERQRLLESVEEVGGTQLATEKIGDFFLGMTQQGDLTKALFGAVNQEGEIDEEILEQYSSGEISYNDMIEMGQLNIENNDELWSSITRNPQMMYDQLGGNQLIDFMTESFDELFVELGYEQRGLTRDAFLSDLGVDNPKLRETIMAAIDGSELISETEITRRTIEDQMREDRLERRSLAGVMEQVRNHLAGAGEAVSRPFVDAATGIKRTYRDLRNEWLGFEDVGHIEMGELDFQFDMSPEGIMSRLSPEYREDIIRGLDTRDSNWRENMDYEQLIGAVENNAESTLRGMYVEEYGQELSAPEAERIIQNGGLRTNFNETMGMALETGINMVGAGRDTFEVEGQEFTMEQFFGDDLSSEQMDLLQGITRSLKRELSGVTNPEERRKIINKYQRDARTLVQGSETTSSIRMHHTLKDNFFKMMEGQFRADDATAGAEIIQGIRGTNQSLGETMHDLYNEEIIENVRDDNQREIFKIGRDFWRGRSSQGEIIGRLEESDLFRRYGDEISELSSGMGKDEFGEALQSILGEEFMRTMSESGAMGYTRTSVDEWEEKWREMIRTDIKDSTETNKDLRETLEGVNKVLEETQRTSEIAIDVYTQNNTGGFSLWNLPFS